MTDEPDFPPRLPTFAAWNAAIAKARDEYEAHPFARWSYVAACVCDWCRRKSDYWREYRRKARA